MPSCPHGFITYSLKRGDTLHNLARIHNTTVKDILNANPGVNPQYLQIGQILCIPHSLPPHALPPQALPPQAPPKQPAIRMSELKLRNAWRSLWADHSAWTRMAIMSNVFNTPDRQFTVARLLRNAPDMGAVIRQFYGAANGDAFAELIRQHLILADQLVSEVKAGKSAAAAETEKKWYQNGDAIAAFLSRLNPHWSLETFRNMFRRHLDLVKDEAASLLKSDFLRSIGVYDAITQQSYEMADSLSAGIVKQFPNLF